MTKILYKELSYQITGLCFQVHRDLGRFCREIQYADRFEELLKKSNINYEREFELKNLDATTTRGNKVDFLIEGKIIIDFKSKKFITKEDYNQIQRYLRAANLELGMIVNFRATYLKPKRILNTDPNIRIHPNKIHSDGSEHSDRLRGRPLNVLFTTSAAPLKSPFSTKEKRPPLGLGSLMSVVKNAGHNIFFIDNYLKSTPFIEDGFLQKNKIDFVGIYANTICYHDTLRMFNALEKLRQKDEWQGKIILGGPHTSVAVQSIPDFVDFIVQGEGEKAILKILNGEMKNRIVREQRILNLDELPFEPWDIFSQLPYNYTCRWLDEKPIFTLNTSRGCPFNCTFCSVGSIWGKGYTSMSADRVLAEIEFLIKNFGAKGIYFREDNFTLNLKRTKEFCEKLIEKNWQIAWACETRVNNLNEELIKLMSRAGCKAFYLGVESCSQKILDLLKKGITLSQIENVINWSKKYHIRAYCSLITGIPGETYDDYLATKKLMERLKPYTYGFNIFVGIPSGELYDYVITNKLYEHIDDLGLVYLPGFDVKCKFFYGRESRYYVDYKFKKNNYSNYDRALLKELRKQWPKRMVLTLKKIIGKILPKTIKEKIKRRS